MIQSAQTSEQIKAGIEERSGFFPLVFSPSLETLEALEKLWQQTLSVYVNNPLPALFKKKLFACLSHYCIVPYCILFRSYALEPLGVTTAEVRALLKDPGKTAEAELAHTKEIAEGQRFPWRKRLQYPLWRDTKDESTPT